jgi:hypothetical protein
MRKFEVHGVQYETGAMDAIEQFHVARRLMPVMNQLQNVFFQLMQEGLVKEGQQAVEVDIGLLMGRIMEPVGQALASMPQADADYVLRACTSRARRQDLNTGTWSVVAMPTGQLMFQDIDINVLMRLVVETIVGNLSSFFPVLQGINGSSTS